MPTGSRLLTLWLKMFQGQDKSPTPPWSAMILLVKHHKFFFLRTSNCPLAPTLCFRRILWGVILHFTFIARNLPRKTSQHQSCIHSAGPVLKVALSWDTPGRFSKLLGPPEPLGCFRNIVSWGQARSPTPLDMCRKCVQNVRGELHAPLIGTF